LYCTKSKQQVNYSKKKSRKIKMLRPYNHSVLISNWLEDRALEEVQSHGLKNSALLNLLILSIFWKAVVKDYLEKKSRGELVSQQPQQGPQFAGPIALTTVNDYSIHIGDVVQLRCDGTLNKDTPIIPKAPRQDCYLAWNGDRASGIASSNVSPYTALVIKR
jgi:hypothetical protein